MWEILQGDCLEVMRGIADNSIDSVVTDPPYGLSKEPDIAEVLTKWLSGEEYRHNHGGFMGKEWDSFVPHPDMWKEVYRVLKPGGHILCFAGTRTVDLMMISLRLAGFVIRDTIHWVYGSGFPKSHNIGKAIDKRKATTTEISQDFADYIKRERVSQGIRLSEADQYVCNGTTNYSWFEGRPAGQRLPRTGEYQKMKQLLSLCDYYDDFIGEAEREVVGEGPYHNPNSRQNWGPEGYKREQIITAPATPEAKQWEGWGSALKPAHEPIVLARKPLSEKTIAANVLKWGTGGLAIDKCRVDYNGETPNMGGRKNAKMGGDQPYGFKIEGRPDKPNTQGRFPANLILSYPEDEYMLREDVKPEQLIELGEWLNENA